MEHIEIGSTGAFRATWRKGNPRSLLRTIINKHRNADESKIHDLFWREVQDDPGLLRACIEYWLDNNYRSVMAEKAAPLDLRQQRAVERSKAIEKERGKIRHRVFNLVIMNLVMPNEKKVSECNKDDCLTIGGWMTAVGKKLPAGKTVGEHFDENALRELWDK
jgi:hypothetical protein